MPTFEIPDGPTTIDAPRSGDATNPGPAQASAVYSVTNTGSDSVDGRLGVMVSGTSKAEWFAVEGDRERNFGPGETQTAKIKVSFPPDAAAGDYPFRLRVVAVNDPDNDHAEGPTTTARLGPGGGGGGGTRSLLWLWILLGVLALIAIGAALYFAFREPDRKPEPKIAQPTTVSKAPELSTSQALDLAETQAGQWVAAYAARNIDSLVKLSKPPFFLDDGAVLVDQVDIRDKYRMRLAPDRTQMPIGDDSKDPGEVDDPPKFDKITPQLISQFKKTEGGVEFDRLMRAMKLSDDDIAVIGSNQGETTILFFRRTGGTVELAGVAG